MVHLEVQLRGRSATGSCLHAGVFPHRLRGELADGRNLLPSSGCHELRVQRYPGELLHDTLPHRHRDQCGLRPVDHVLHGYSDHGGHGLPHRERGSAGRCGQLPREVRELRVAALHGSTALRVRVALHLHRALCGRALRSDLPFLSPFYAADPEPPGAQGLGVPQLARRHRPGAGALRRLPGQRVPGSSGVLLPWRLHSLDLPLLHRRARLHLCLRPLQGAPGGAPVHLQLICSGLLCAGASCARLRHFVGCHHLQDELPQRERHLLQRVPAAHRLLRGLRGALRGAYLPAPILRSPLRG
mmetsp:Transcript_32873/g.78703  ORF Transcript_32873/g.78703 Transcript_32873/m.78703 type:complete len:300 (-) Transcript_32873:286-1185(-)